MKLVQKHPRELFKITVKAVTILPQEQNFSKHKKESQPEFKGKAT